MTADPSRAIAGDLTGRVVIVTGGASGMGAATVRILHRTGALPVIVDRNESLAFDVARELALPDGCVFGGDVGDSAFADRVVTETVKRHGRLDGLVNAAGIIVRAAGVDTTDEEWTRIMNINVGGTFFFCRAAITAMRAKADKSGGAIVNFGSIWGDLGSAGVAAYCASKGAVHNLTRALALDHVKEGIRVNAVCPGEVNTPMLSSERKGPVTQEILDGLAATVPMGRLADPSEIAKVVVFLLSDGASYMTGTLVSVDAGFGAR